MDISGTLVFKILSLELVTSVSVEYCSVGMSSVVDVLLYTLSSSVVGRDVLLASCFFVVVLDDGCSLVIAVLDSVDAVVVISSLLLPCVEVDRSSNCVVVFSVQVAKVEEPVVIVSGENVVRSVAFVVVVAVVVAA